jgi:hypothetical protein
MDARPRRSFTACRSAPPARSHEACACPSPAGSRPSAAREHQPHPPPGRCRALRAWIIGGGLNARSHDGCPVRRVLRCRRRQPALLPTWGGSVPEVVRTASAHRAAWFTSTWLIALSVAAGIAAVELLARSLARCGRNGTKREAGICAAAVRARVRASGDGGAAAPPRRDHPGRGSRRHRQDVAGGGGLLAGGRARPAGSAGAGVGAGGGVRVRGGASAV